MKTINARDIEEDYRSFAVRCEKITIFAQNNI